MIVYRDQRSWADPRRLLSELRTATRRVAGAPSHEIARDILITAGTLEAGVLDILFPQSDGMHPLAGAFRSSSVFAGRVLWHTWHSRAEEAQIWWNQLAQQLDGIAQYPLPAVVEITVPEGYAQYAVYPEMYLEAAKQVHANFGRIDAVCLGLRSIGTSLSGAVAAGLSESGCTVRSATLRPRGHPFSRYPIVTAELSEFLRPNSGTHYLIVDEGPGLSGSSFAGTIELLREWGVAADRILLFPSWETDGSQLRSSVAREAWSRYRRFTASFEDVWLRSGRLGADFPGEMRDVSAGEWRPEVYPDPAEYPAVQPQHERRKYLLSSGPTAPTKLLSFVGLGDRARKKVCRAHRLAQAGFTPEPESLAHGFLLRPFVPGTPLSPAGVNPEVLEQVAAYLAHLSVEHQAEPTVSESNLREMIDVNLLEGLGPAWTEKIPAELYQGSWAERVVALDGRVLAHEWIRTADGYLKVDALDHHQDHFFPGCQDIAWDVAASVFELGLTAEGRRALIGRYRRLSGDQTISRRVCFYATAYLAFRLGYTAMAVSVLGDSPDGRRFAAETQRYSGLLQQELSGGWQVWCDA
jgi:hypothetical protein